MGTAGERDFDPSGSGMGNKKEKRARAPRRAGKEKHLEGITEAGKTALGWSTVWHKWFLLGCAGLKQVENSLDHLVEVTEGKEMQWC